MIRTANRLKFFVASKTESASPGSEENKQFYKWTPSGSLEFGSINQAALDQLPLGSEVYIDLTVIPKPEPISEKTPA